MLARRLLTGTATMAFMLLGLVGVTAADAATYDSQGRCYSWAEVSFGIHCDGWRITIENTSSYDIWYDKSSRGIWYDKTINAYSAPNVIRKKTHSVRDTLGLAAIGGGAHWVDLYYHSEAFASGWNYRITVTSQGKVNCGVSSDTEGMMPDHVGCEQLPPREDGAISVRFVSADDPKFKKPAQQPPGMIL